MAGDLCKENHQAECVSNGCASKASSCACKKNRELILPTANADRLPRKPKERPQLPFRFPGVNGEDCLRREGGNSLSEQLMSQRTPRSPAGLHRCFADDGRRPKGETCADVPVAICAIGVWPVVPTRRCDQKLKKTPAFLMVLSMIELAARSPGAPRSPSPNGAKCSDRQDVYGKAQGVNQYRFT